MTNYISCINLNLKSQFFYFLTKANIFHCKFAYANCISTWVFVTHLLPIWCEPWILHFSKHPSLPTSNPFQYNLLQSQVLLLSFYARSILHQREICNDHFLKKVLFHFLNSSKMLSTLHQIQARHNILVIRKRFTKFSTEIIGLNQST